MEFAKENVIELDSTTSEKFSRHLIIRLPGHALAGYDVAKEFVDQLLAQPTVSLSRHAQR